MNSKLKAAVAVLALATAGAATASPIPTEGLFLSLRDTVNNTSLVINLGLTTTQFRGSSTSPYTLGGDGLADLTAFLSTANLGGIRWNLQGASTGAGTLFGGLTTSTINPGTGDWGSDAVLNAVNSFTTFRNIVNTVDQTNGNPRLTTSEGYNTTGLGAYFTVQNAGVGIPTLGNLGQALGFYSFFADPNDPEGFTGASTSFNGNWLLNFAAGVASLTFNSSVAPTVPVPAAVWLLASGVAGLFGVSRRKRVAA